MNELFTSPSINFFVFLAGGLMVIFIFLRYDKAQQRKIISLFKQVENVPPIYEAKSASDQLNCKNIAEASDTRRIIAGKLDHLVAEFDNGHITLPDYCRQLNKLLTMMKS